MVPGALLTSITSIGRFALLFIVVFIGIYLLRNALARRRPVSTGLTWGCGYPAPTPRMQYTGKSFSKSLGKLLNFIILEKNKYKEITASEIFPAERTHSSHYNDFFAAKIFDGMVDKLLFFMNYFKFIQNGKIQLYILYGALFILLIFIGTIFNFI